MMTNGFTALSELILGHLAIIILIIQDFQVGPGRTLIVAELMVATSTRALREVALTIIIAVFTRGLRQWRMDSRVKVGNLEVQHRRQLSMQPEAPSRCEERTARSLSVQVVP